MTKIFGITESRICGHVIGVGRKCVCWNIYWTSMFKKPHGWLYIADSDDVLFNLHANNAGRRFWIFGVSITDLEPVIDNID